MQINKQTSLSLAKTLSFMGLSEVTAGLVNETFLECMGEGLKGVFDTYATDSCKNFVNALNEKHTTEGSANHDLQKGFKNAMICALVEIERAYNQKPFDDVVKEQIKTLINDLIQTIRSTSENMLADFSEQNINDYLNDTELAIALVDDNFKEFKLNAEKLDIEFKKYFTDNFPKLVELYFGEILKDSKENNVKVWKAYQKMIFGNIVENQNDIIFKQYEAGKNIEEILSKINEIRLQKTDDKVDTFLDNKIIHLESDLQIIIADLRKFKTIMLSILADLKSGQGKLIVGQGDLKSGQGELKVGQGDLKSGQDELKLGIDDLEDKVIKLGKGQDEMKKQLGLGIIPKHLSLVPKPEVFIGRANILEEIRNNLCDKTNDEFLLLVNGEW